MARGRHRAAYFGTSQSRLYGFQRTKGHSILPQRSYGLLAGRGHYYSDDEYPVPGTYRPITSLYHGADYYMADAMTNHATNMSTDTVYDNIDLAAKSRGKDKRLMTQVNAALAYATPSTPARARASRRAERQQQPPAATTTSSAYNYYRVPYQEDISYTPTYSTNPDRYDRFGLRAKRRAAGVYASGSLASKATPKPSSAKAIRQPEGFTKPKNLLSWQHRIDTYVDPSDVFYTPASVYKMRDRVREAQEKLDLHRQMLDRYLQVDLGPGDDVAARIARKQKDVEDRQPVIEEYKCDIKPVKLLIPKEPPFRIYIPKDSGGKGSSEGGSGGATSALRQRLRKVVCKTRNDPTYYKD